MQAPANWFLPCARYFFHALLPDIASTTACGTRHRGGPQMHEPNGGLKRLTGNRDRGSNPCCVILDISLAAAAPCLGSRHSWSGLRYRPRQRHLPFITARPQLTARSKPIACRWRVTRAATPAMARLKSKLPAPHPRQALNCPLAVSRWSAQSDSPRSRGSPGAVSPERAPAHLSALGAPRRARFRFVPSAAG